MVDWHQTGLQGYCSWVCYCKSSLINPRPSSFHKRLYNHFMSALKKGGAYEGLMTTMHEAYCLIWFHWKCHFIWTTYTRLYVRDSILSNKTWLQKQSSRQSKSESKVVNMRYTVNNMTTDLTGWEITTTVSVMWITLISPREGDNRLVN